MHPESTARVRDAMIAEPRALPATATAREAGEVLTPAEVRAVFVVGDDGELVGCRHPQDARRARRRRRPRSERRRGRRARGARRTTRSRRTRRSTRRSGSSRRTTPSGCPSSTTAASWASSPARCSSGGSPKTSPSRQSCRRPHRSLLNPRDEPEQAPYGVPRLAQRLELHVERGPRRGEPQRRLAEPAARGARPVEVRLDPSRRVRDAVTPRRRRRRRSA